MAGWYGDPAAASQTSSSGLDMSAWRQLIVDLLLLRLFRELLAKVAFGVPGLAGTSARKAPLARCHHLRAMYRL